MANKFNTYNESFQGNALPGNWTAFTGGSATLSYSSAGAQVNYPATTSSSTDGDITLATQYDLTANRVFLNIRGVPTGSTSSDCAFKLRASGSGSNLIGWLWEGGTMFAQQVVATVQSNLTSFAFNATAHAWWSIRETAGTTYWETSPDGINWTVRFSVANPITVTSMDCLIAGTCFGVDTNNTPFIWRSFNLNNSIHPVNRGPRPHPFSPGLAR